jgi:hypothetical protein
LRCACRRRSLIRRNTHDQKHHVSRSQYHFPTSPQQPLRRLLGTHLQLKTSYLPHPPSLAVTNHVLPQPRQVTSHAMSDITAQFHSCPNLCLLPLYRTNIYFYKYFAGLRFAAPTGLGGRSTSSSAGTCTSTPFFPSFFPSFSRCLFFPTAVALTTFQLGCRGPMRRGRSGSLRVRAIVSFRAQLWLFCNRRTVGIAKCWRNASTFWLTPPIPWEG